MKSHGKKPCRKFMVHLHHLDGQEVFTRAVNLDQPERLMSGLGVQNIEWNLVPLIPISVYLLVDQPEFEGKTSSG